MAGRGGQAQREARHSTASLDIGYVDDETDPEKWFDQVGALDGGIDALSGHGTFIAGLIHQACPDADIVAWRVVGSEGPIVESDLVKTLERIAEVARKHRDGEKGGYPIDVLNLSMGYYHETPKDQQFDKTMYGILEKLGECGVAVVCSAGNDATARAMFPAAFGPWSDGTADGAAEPGRRTGRSRSARSTPTATRRAVQQRRTVGARRTPRAPGDEHDAARLPGRPGAGGAQRGLPAGPRVDRPRQLHAGFALWSGTSFAAPLFAGRIAARLAAASIDRRPHDRAGAAAVAARLGGGGRR